MVLFFGATTKSAGHASCPAESAVPGSASGGYVHEAPGLMKDACDKRPRARCSDFRHSRARPSDRRVRGMFGADRHVCSGWVGRGSELGFLSNYNSDHARHRTFLASTAGAVGVLPSRSSCAATKALLFIDVSKVCPCARPPRTRRGFAGEGGQFWTWLSERECGHGPELIHERLQRLYRKTGNRKNDARIIRQGDRPLPARFSCRLAAILWQFVFVSIAARAAEPMRRNMKC